MTTPTSETFGTTTCACGCGTIVHDGTRLVGTLTDRHIHGADRISLTYIELYVAGHEPQQKSFMRPTCACTTEPFTHEQAIARALSVTQDQPQPQQTFLPEKIAAWLLAGGDIPYFRIWFRLAVVPLWAFVVFAVLDADDDAMLLFAILVAPAFYVALRGPLRAWRAVG